MLFFLLTQRVSFLLTDGLDYRDLRLRRFQIHSLTLFLLSQLNGVGVEHLWARVQRRLVVWMLWNLVQSESFLP